MARLLKCLPGIFSFKLRSQKNVRDRGLTWLLFESIKETSGLQCYTIKPYSLNQLLFKSIGSMLFNVVQCI